MNGFLLSRRRLWRPLRRVVLAVFIAGLLLLAGGGDYRPTAVDLAAAPYRYNILAWELNHLPGGWLRRLVARWPGRETLTEPERNAQAREFFALGQELRRWEQRRQLAGVAVHPPSIQELASLARLDARRRELRPAAEIAVEQAISQALTEQGIVTSWGGVFPPVDVVFGGPPHLLMVSPRDRIYAQQSALLRPELSDRIKAEIEAELRRSDDLSALVEDTGGLSVYPSLALDTVGLRYALEIAAHEWLHQWLFFRPLGRNFRASPEMLTLNETVASIAGAELGQQAYAAMTGTPPPGPPLSDPAAPPPEPPAASRNIFDFTAEMRQTRRRAEELLAAGQIAAAEGVYGTAATAFPRQRLLYPQTEPGLLCLSRQLRHRPRLGQSHRRAVAGIAPPQPLPETFSGNRSPIQQLPGVSGVYRKG